MERRSFFALQEIASYEAKALLFLLGEMKCSKMIAEVCGEA